MRLRSFSVGGYRSYRSTQTVELDERLTLLAGRNNVGKSALLAALLGPLRPPVDRRAGMPPETFCFEWELAVEEAVMGLATPQRPQSQVLPGENATGEVLSDWLRSAGDRLTMRASYGPSTPRLASIELPQLEARASGNPGSIGWDNGPFAGSSTTVDFFGRMAMRGLERLRHIAPRRIEPSARQWRTDELLKPDAHNLTEVLAYLDGRRPTTFDALQAIVRSAFPSVRRIRVQDDGQGQGMARPVLFFDGAPDDEAVPLSDCGTGVEQLVALAAGVLSATEPMIFLVDEPQAYLHPQAERVLLDLLESHPAHQYVVATHSSVLLGTVGLEQVRLIHLDAGQSYVTHDAKSDRVLSELGVTASDLWLCDRLLWVEGPTEEMALELIAREVLTRAQRASLTVRRMPTEAARFASSNNRNATAAYQFCEQTSAAVSALPVRMTFLFDRDEKSLERRDALRVASGGRANFLGVREFENFLLRPEVLQGGIADRLQDVNGAEVPSVPAIDRALVRLLANTEDAALFPGGPPTDDPLVDVKGSELLNRLWHETTLSGYDKVRDGALLVRHALRLCPEQLSPLAEVLHAALEEPDRP